MNIRTPGRKPGTAWRLAMVLSIVASPAPGQEPSDLTEIHETFDNGRWDRHWWTIDRQTPPGVNIDLSGDALRVTIPPGESGRPPAAMKSRFRLEGDFEIEAAFYAHALPEPASEWINIQVYIDGPGGPAAMMRTNNALAGSGYGLWWESPEEDAPGAWEHDPSESMGGTLRMRRTGTRLTFEYTESVPDAEFIELGQVEYGDGPVTSVELWVSVPETKSAVDVTFDDVAVRADAIIDPSLPAESPIGPRWWHGIIILVVVVLLGFAGWRVLVWRNR